MEGRGEEKGTVLMGIWTQELQCEDGLEFLRQLITVKTLKFCPIRNHRQKNNRLEVDVGTSLVAQWLRIRLPMQGTRVRALVWEDPTCHGATKPMHHNY